VNCAIHDPFPEFHENMKNAGSVLAQWAEA